MLCEVCGKREAVGRCRICGRWVCSKHLINGVCVVCRDLMCEVCRKRLAVSSCLICGKLICRSCSVELQPGIRLCMKCYENIDLLISKYPRLSYIRRYLRGK